MSNFFEKYLLNNVSLYNTNLFRLGPNSQKSTNKEYFL